MKKHRRLVLDRTTLRALDRADLAAVAGASSECDSTTPKCPSGPNASAASPKGENPECFSEAGF